MKKLVTFTITAAIATCLTGCNRDNIETDEAVGGSQASQEWRVGSTVPTNIIPPETPPDFAPSAPYGTPSFSSHGGTGHSEKARREHTSPFDNPSAEPFLPVGTPEAVSTPQPTATPEDSETALAEHQATGQAQSSAASTAPESTGVNPVVITNIGYPQKEPTVAGTSTTIATNMPAKPLAGIYGGYENKNVPNGQSAVGLFDRNNPERILPPEGPARGAAPHEDLVASNRLAEQVRKALGLPSAAAVSGLTAAAVSAPPIEVVVTNGVVTLKGYVETTATKEEMASRAQRVQGVREVKNELEISQSFSPGDGRSPSNAP